MQPRDTLAGMCWVYPLPGVIVAKPGPAASEAAGGGQGSRGPGVGPGVRGSGVMAISPSAFSAAHSNLAHLTSLHYPKFRKSALQPYSPTALEMKTVRQSPG
jgi:hypothetical protein